MQGLRQHPKMPERFLNGRPFVFGALFQVEAQEEGIHVQAAKLLAMGDPIRQRFEAVMLFDPFLDIPVGDDPLRH
jgi:hypothetical protein